MKQIAQIFGFLAICCSLIIYSRNDRKKLLTFKCIQDICWCSHYLLLSAWSAAATSALCISRSLVFYKSREKGKSGKMMLFLYLGLYAISALLTWKSIFSIFPAVSSSFSTVAFWMKNPKHTKLLAICAATCTLIYNLTTAHSLSVYIGVAITVSTSVSSLLLPLLRKKQAEEKE